MWSRGTECVPSARLPWVGSECFRAEAGPGEEQEAGQRGPGHAGTCLVSTWRWDEALPFMPPTVS